MFYKLSRDYWRPTVRRPLLRTVLAFLIAPLPVTAIFLGISWFLMAQMTGSYGIATEQVMGHAGTVCVGTYVVALTGGVLAFLLLWSMRLRGFIDYLISGLTLGAAAGAAPALFAGEPVRIIPVCVLAVTGALLLMFIRIISGVRSIRKTR